MINFEDVIVHFGKQAGDLLKQGEEEAQDIRTVRILKDKDAPDRSTAIREWLRRYAVFQGIVEPKRKAIARAVLK